MFNIFRKKKETPYTPIIDDEKPQQNKKISENKNIPHEPPTIIYESEKFKSPTIKLNNMPEDDSGIIVSVASDTGKIRSSNEDNFYCDEIGYRITKNCSYKKKIRSQRCIFAVCDGMGGESYGELASQIAVETLAKLSTEINSAESNKLHKAVNKYADEANRHICDMAEEKLCNRSGSTLAIVCIVDKYIYTFNIGDSRVYFFLNDTIKQVTEDQTLAMRKLKANIYTEEEAKNSPDAHKITSFLGVDDRRIGLNSLEYKPFELGDGKILICSDGLTDMCSDEEIKEILSSNYENDAEILVKKALENGGEDNVTCMVIQKFMKG
ncbi:MAG: protein phosphatase 2C domain-containing protein [Ruminococcus sp.]|nr:protein phosphatase 2C domain-containing protein [Ruminococcus sp.]